MSFLVILSASELRQTGSGQSVASFSVATNRSWQDPQSGDRKDSVEFHDVVAWGKLGELVSNYLTKGRKVLVVGRLQTRTWEADGVKKQRTEIVANDINFLGGGPGEAGPAAPVASGSKKSDEPEIQEMPGDDINLDDIPF
jgi:single-strand DNA-binding protein